MSASMTPGTCGASSVHRRIVIELRNSAAGLVVEMPLIEARPRAGPRYRSIVAALIACNSAWADLFQRLCRT